MNRLLPASWKELVRKLRKYGFTGPFIGGKHSYMVKGGLVLTIPNPHKDDIGVSLLIRILKQAGISKGKWFSL